MSKLPSLDVDSELARLAEPEPEPESKTGAGAGEGGKGKRGPSAGRKEYVTSIERQRRAALRWAIGGIVLGGLGVLYYGGDDKAAQAGPEGAPTVGAFERIKNNAAEFFDVRSSIFQSRDGPLTSGLQQTRFHQAPPRPSSCPTPAPIHSSDRPRGHVDDLDMGRELASMNRAYSYSPQRQHGWRTAKRPGTDYFLAYLSLFYEVVLFTSQPSYVRLSSLVVVVIEICTDDRPPWVSLRSSTPSRPTSLTVSSVNLHALSTARWSRCVSSLFHRYPRSPQDLSYLNRDLSKVILLDTNPEHAALQPDNAIIMKPWEGKGGEEGLVELIPFLECTYLPHAAICVLGTNNSPRIPQRPGRPPNAQGIPGQGHPQGVRQDRGRAEAPRCARVGTQPPLRHPWCRLELADGLVRQCVCGASSLLTVTRPAKY